MIDTHKHTVQITTTDFIPGKKIIKILGIARGGTIRARHIGRDIGAGLKSIIGGELKGYSQMIDMARSEALKRLRKDAEEMGADAVINIRLVTAQVMQGAAEVMAYGTAVTLKKK